MPTRSLHNLGGPYVEVLDHPPLNATPRPRRAVSVVDDGSPESDHPWDRSGESRTTARRLTHRLARLALPTVMAVLTSLGFHLFLASLNSRPWAAPPAPLTAGLLWAFGAVSLCLITLYFVRSAAGTLILTFTHFPYEPGSPVTLLFRNDARSVPFRSLVCTLRCVREHTPRSAYKMGLRHPRAHLVWSDTIEFEPPHEMPSPGSDVELVFHPPADAPPTRLARALPIYWELRVVADAPGSRIDESFLVPVYRPEG